MNLSRTTLKKAHAYLGVCEFCGRIAELSYYDSVLESAVCGECAQDLATGENELIAAGIVAWMHAAPKIMGAEYGNNTAVCSFGKKKRSKSRSLATVV